MSAEIGSDEVWLEVICQANLEIAGSPRNISRYSPVYPAWRGEIYLGVELWMVAAVARP